MRQVRWAGWTMAVATALVIAEGQVVRADIASDKPAAIVVYPKVRVDTTDGVDTKIRLANTNTNNPILLSCYYVDANSHCSGGANDGAICTDNPGVCTGLSFCLPSWQETDFRILLTPGQPIQWAASIGLSDSLLPIPAGRCIRNPTKSCGSDADCNPFPGGPCTFSNAGTRVPPVPEDPFVGTLTCIAIDNNGVPVSRNDVKGEAILETSTAVHLDIASYNAEGIQATGNSDGVSNQLVLGPGSAGEYNGCPNYLILNHFFDGSHNPVPGTNATILTDLTLVPCSTDFLRQIPGLAVAQFLVFNEFEQRFSTSKSVRCFLETQLSLIDTLNPARSIWNVATAGTLTGQTRINPIGVSSTNPPSIPSGLLGVAIEEHTDGASGEVKSAAFNLFKQGQRDVSDVLITP